MSGPLTISVVVVTGMLLGAGVFALWTGMRSRVPRLADALDRMDGLTDLAGAPNEPLARGDRLGAWIARRSPIPLLESQRRMLALKNVSTTEFYADKAVMALVGALVPAVAGSSLLILFSVPVLVPVAAGLLGALIGFFVPDLLLRRVRQRFETDAAEAVFTYFDLVTLERLANLSAIQALHSAANLADNPVFVRIDAALARARLEQQPPYAELRRLAEQLRLPQLGDLADVMQLEEAGASLSAALRGRVRELRDAHLAAVKIAAHNRSEQMTLFMTLPAMIFGLIFLLPPLMRLLGQ